MKPDVEVTGHGTALRFNHGIELFISNPNEDRMFIWLTREESSGEVFELSEKHRLALWQLFAPDRTHT